jgi:protein CpxP
MKRTLLAVFVVTALAVFAAAQSDSPRDHSGKSHSPQARLDRMSQKLNLTADQKQGILPILQDESNKAQSLRDDTSLSQDDKRAKFHALRQETMSKIRPLLNQDQQQKLDAMASKKGGHHRGDSGSKPE